MFGIELHLLIQFVQIIRQALEVVFDCLPNIVQTGLVESFDRHCWFGGCLLTMRNFPLVIDNKDTARKIERRKSERRKVVYGMKS